ncbi:hypothetical protein [Rhizobium leguminosarum]|uniref:hypothetical protein n=1 Tax=Rhizobium leguminosarum TaxID=384 RepID=UPI0013DBFA3C|nr:hypothetical protein [Rhizobium leguminosarum]NEK36302.1 hypothetical protein [Rhizobium leguminosarum]
MTSIAIDRVDGLSSAAAIKGPCRVATTANIALYAEQTIDGVAVVTGNRVLVKNQTTPSENGIWICDTGQWRRSKDFVRTNDVVKGTQIAITDGTVSGGFVYALLTNNPINVGASSLSFGISAGAQIAVNAANAAAASAVAAAASAASVIPLTYATKAGDYTALTTDRNAWHRYTAIATVSLTAAATLGNSWTYKVTADGADVTIDPNGVEVINGTTALVVPNGYSTTIVCTGTAFYSDGLISNTTLAAAVLGDFVVGLTLSNNSGSSTTHVDFAAGSARADSSFVSRATSFTKRVDTAWAAGSGNGGLASGAVAANTTYFAYALRKTTDGTFDVVFSTSATVGGVTTTLLTGYTIVKCIGVVLTDGSSLVRQFIMNPRDDYTFVTPIRDAVNAAISTTSALLALTVPNAVKVKAKLRFMFSSSSTTNSALFHDPAQGTLVAGGNDSGGNVGTIQVASGYAVGVDNIWTNTSKQVRRVAGASGNIWVWTDGFIFPCGRNA